MVLVPLGGGKQGFATGQVAAAHQPFLLQLPQMAIDGGQAHGAGPTPQARMQLLARKLLLGSTKFRQQQLLARR